VTNLAIKAPAKNYSQPAVGLTELILTSDEPEQLGILLPMIAFISNSACDRWISWIAPHNVTRELLESYGVNTTRIRIIPTAADRRLQITKEALLAGNSHTVITTLTDTSPSELAMLENATYRGNCQAILLRTRQQVAWDQHA
jgi:cell division inhibitor SulA